MTNREKLLRERRRADELELDLIQFQRSEAKMNSRLGELARQNAQLRDALNQLQTWRQELVEAQRDLNVANDRIGALTSLVERLTFVADFQSAASLLPEPSLVTSNPPASILAIDPVRWVELLEQYGAAYEAWKADRGAAE